MLKKDKGVAPATSEQLQELQSLADIGISSGDAQEYIDAYKLAIKRATSTSEIYRVQRLIRGKIRALRMADNLG